MLPTLPSSQNSLYIHYFLLPSGPPWEANRAELLFSFADDEPRPRQVRWFAQGDISGTGYPDSSSDALFPWYNALLLHCGTPSCPPQWYKGAGLNTHLLSPTLSPFNLLVSLTLVSYSLTRMPGSVMDENRHNGFVSNSLAVWSWAR